jgi:short-subunit dehydrogenase
VILDIVISSDIGFAPMAYQSRYSATKAALIGLTGSLRYELWDEKIRLSNVIPGTVATPIWEKAGCAPASAITPEEAACRQFLSQPVTIWSQNEKGLPNKSCNPLILLMGGTGFEPVTSTV